MWDCSCPERKKKIVLNVSMQKLLVPRLGDYEHKVTMYTNLHRDRQFIHKTRES